MGAACTLIAIILSLILLFLIGYVMFVKNREEYTSSTNKFKHGMAVVYNATEQWCKATGAFFKKTSDKLFKKKKQADNDGSDATTPLNADADDASDTVYKSEENTAL